MYFVCLMCEGDRTGSLHRPMDRRAICFWIKEQFLYSRSKMLITQDKKNRANTRKESNHQMHYKIDLKVGTVYNLGRQRKVSSYLYNYHKIADDETKNWIIKTKVNDLAVLSSPVQ